PSSISFVPSETRTSEVNSDIQEEISAPGFSHAENEESTLRDYLFDDDDDDFVEDARPIEGMSITDGIRYWALSTNATYRSINMILKLFQQARVKVPSTAKTLLKTDRHRSSQIVEIGGGQFWYRGIKRCLNNTEKTLSTQLSLTISIDGLPLHTNSSMQFWPIMFSIYELPQAPVMTAAIFCGPKKPESVEEYLRPMVNEMNDLMQRGIIVHGRHVAIRLRAIVADTPARAFIKGVKGHTGYESCLKCTVVGKYSQAGRTMTFPGTNAPKRTDKSFRDNTYPGHHKTETPLVDLQFFNIINDIPTGDRLHCIDQGVGKHLVLGFRDGTLGKQRWTTKQCLQISEDLAKIKLPSEIHRKIRPVSQAHFWKGSESASFLHYAGFVVMESHLPDREYRHYMLLFCAVTLLSSSVYKEKWRLAGQLLNKFIEDFASVYGERYISSNVHILQHLFEEVERFGPLSSFSTYPFENQLQHLKKLLRSGWKELEQAINRLLEYEEYYVGKAHMASYPSISKRGNIVTFNLRKDFMLQNSEKNCWYMSKDTCIYQFQTVNGQPDDGNLRICGRKLKDKSLAFHYPYDSSIINAFKGSANNLEMSFVYICPGQVK
uniref:Transposase domain-containing protein n=1 Tax=Anopheles epiroticus TaxID=199890 RepID=A0A182PWP3_9DIPT